MITFDELDGFIVDKPALAFQVVEKLNLYYVAVETARILLDNNDNMKYTEAINRRIRQHKTNIANLLRIFIFTHKNNDATNEYLIEKSKDATHKRLLILFKDIMNDNSITNKLLKFLEIVINEDLSLETTYT